VCGLRPSSCETWEILNVSMRLPYRFERALSQVHGRSTMG